MLEVFTCEQSSPEWHAARLGIPTASEFGTVLAQPQKGKSVSLTRRTYLYKLAGEQITGEPTENYTNQHFERGKLLEDDARRYYQLLTNRNLEPVGFIRDNAQRTGVSPDSLVDAEGALEVKTKLPHLMIDCILSGTFPPEHKPQCQGCLWITGRKWIDLAIYWPTMDPSMFIIRAYRDEAYIKALAGAVEQFNADLDEVVARLRRCGPFGSLKADLVASIEAA